MIKDSCFLWNSGMFFAHQRVLKKSFENVASYLLDPVKKASDKAKVSEEL